MPPPQVMPLQFHSPSLRPTLRFLLPGFPHPANVMTNLMIEGIGKSKVHKEADSQEKLRTIRDKYINADQDPWSIFICPLNVGRGASRLASSVVLLETVSIKENDPSQTFEVFRRNPAKEVLDRSASIEWGWILVTLVDLTRKVMLAIGGCLSHVRRIAVCETTYKSGLQTSAQWVSNMKRMNDEHLTLNNEL